MSSARELTTEQKERARQRAREWYLSNKERAKAYRLAHPVSPEARSKYQAKYLETNKEAVVLQKKAYRDSHKKQIAAYGKEYERHKYATDLDFRLKKALRARFRAACKGVGSGVRELGCTVEELKRHLESRFEIGMTWENYGYRGWHIDHIVPLCEFDLQDPEQRAKAVHFTNLQPLWWKENLSKGGRS